MDITGAVSVGWRRRVRDAITYLAESGEITLPRTKFDHTSTPPLPLYVTRIERASQPHRVRSDPPVWHADLGWAAALSDRGALTNAQMVFLAAVNAWLPTRRRVSVPLRERSLEIFGDEKLLDTWVSGPLFGPGRLSLKLLQTYLCWPQVERVNLGAGDWLLVENYTTYHSLGLQARTLGFDGQIIWGAGAGVTTRLAALAQERHRPQRIFYFGDIDIAGVRIARSAVTRARELDFAPVAAAAGLYQLTIDHGRTRDENQSGRHPAVFDWAQRWIGGPVGVAVRETLAAGMRIVQETVGTELLHTTTLNDWF